MPVKSTQNGGFANDVMAVETVLPAPSPDHEKARRRNGARMHVMLPVATNAIEGLQRASLTAGLSFPPKYLAPVVVNRHIMGSSIHNPSTRSQRVGLWYKHLRATGPTRLIASLLSPRTSSDLIEIEHDPISAMAADCSGSPQ